MDAIAEVGPGGHFFGAAHTRERYETAFYAPLLSDWRNFETWQEAGRRPRPSGRTRSTRNLLADFEPPLDLAIREELAAFVAKRKGEGGIAGRPRPVLDNSPPGLAG